MAAGTITLKHRLAMEPNGSCTDNTSVFFVCKNGDVMVYTIATGAIARMSGLPVPPVQCLCVATDGTNLFGGCDDGGIRNAVIATGVVTLIARLPGKVISLSYYNNILYATVDGGVVYTVTTT